MRSDRIHYTTINIDGKKRYLCEGKKKYKYDERQTTDDMDEITCQNCKKVLLIK